MSDAIFARDGERFVPGEGSGSPWAAGLLHGGPPAGLLARAVELHAGDPGMHVSRLTVDLLRPVPKEPLTVTARTIRTGKRIHVVEASLLAAGVEVSRATGLLLRRSEVAAPPRDRSAMPDGPHGLETSGLGRGLRGGRLGFHTTVEARWVTRPGDPGPNVAWLRMPVPLVAGEPATPLVRAAALSDFVNAVGGMGARDIGYINADCSLYLHRYPEGEWIGLRVERRVEPTGLGSSQATLYDAAGPIGWAAQAVLANRMD